MNATVIVLREIDVLLSKKLPHLMFSTIVNPVGNTYTIDVAIIAIYFHYCNSIVVDDNLCWGKANWSPGKKVKLSLTVIDNTWWELLVIPSTSMADLNVPLILPYHILHQYFYNRIEYWILVHMFNMHIQLPSQLLSLLMNTNNIYYHIYMCYVCQSINVFMAKYYCHY